MKYIILACLLVTFSHTMDQAPIGEIGEEIKAKIPSLRLLALQSVEEHMATIGWQVVGCESLIYDIIEAEGLFGTNPFEKARLIDKFRLRSKFEFAAKELASYLDNHDTATERKHALLELVKFSQEMQTMIARYRKN